MKAFNLEEVKNGAKTVTRDGRNARVICFDAKGYYPIIALVETERGEEKTIFTTKNGKFYGSSDNQSDLDLFMYEEQEFNLEDAIKEGCKNKK